jgi:hypothetical protein
MASITPIGSHGYPLNISNADSPAFKHANIVSAGTRVPSTQGWPPITPGLLVIATFGNAAIRSS